ncbi:testican-2-like [Dunckerocampus dactyliophorus]|uniref:testican-2-like n=1 Tax=Dunckerocampus dactyliophorus TaxID=161453 RepID=UPI0024070F81|nr:testican-2-like [Dunckerocampus dactyliophorus]
MVAAGSSLTAACLCLLLGSFSLQLDADRGGKEAEHQEERRGGRDAAARGANLMDQRRLSTISQYSSSKIKHWNRFRDEVEDDYIKNMEESLGSDENVDSTKDLCQNVKCSRQKVCMAQGSQRAMCVSRKKLEHRAQQRQQPGAGDTICAPCPPAASGPVCGSDGHNYASQCKLQQQACLTGKALIVMCAGFCPCGATHVTSTKEDAKHESCTGQDLADLGDRLQDWFQLLHGNAKQNNSGKLGARTASALDKSLLASCKDSISWMFLKLDADADLHLDQSELAAINLDKYEVCIRDFFNSCDSYKDGKVSMAEWCLCFWREKPPCLAELERIQMQDVSTKKHGMYVPSCDEDGYYRKLQCDQSGGECWCVDNHGGEVMATRIRGKPDCDEVLGYSGDIGSGVGWEDDDEEAAGGHGDEAEEEQEEEVADDGGYIW